MDDIVDVDNEINQIKTLEMSALLEMKTEENEKINTILEDEFYYYDSDIESTLKYETPGKESYYMSPSVEGF